MSSQAIREGIAVRWSEVSSLLTYSGLGRVRMRDEIRVQWCLVALKAPARTDRSFHPPSLHFHYIPRSRGRRCAPLPNPGGKSLPFRSPRACSIPMMTSSPSDKEPETSSVAVPSEIPVCTGTYSSSPSGPCFQTDRFADTRRLPGDGPRWLDDVRTGLASSPICSVRGGTNRNAAFGTLSTSSLWATTIETLAVIPGFSLRSLLSTATTTLYVTTFCTFMGASRTCRIVPENCWPG